LPVLTQIGETFAGRVAVSLLNAVGLPELIAETQEQFESMARRIGNRAGAALCDPTQARTKSCDKALVQHTAIYGISKAPTRRCTAAVKTDCCLTTSTLGHSERRARAAARTTTL
jgi:hypothetical protein